MKNNYTYLVYLQYVEDTVEVGEGSLVRIEGIGKLKAKKISDVVVKVIEAINVAYLPEMPINFLSVSCLRKKGYLTRFWDDPNNSRNSMVEIIEKR